jgi:hypothetical protein
MTQQNKALVLSLLFPSDNSSIHLTNDEWVTAYLLCNGFGDINYQTEHESGFDITHVRDSSLKGFDKDLIRI